MNRDVTQTAHVLGEDVQQVDKWACLFKEFLSSNANPPQGQTRQFSDSDLLVLSYVYANWEDDPDLEAIKIGLNQGEHHAERFVEHLYFHTPFFQEPPDGLDETWFHGALLGGTLNVDLREQSWMIADAYRLAGDALVDSIEKNRTHEAYEVIWPVLFLYRHALELYLKLIVQPAKLGHKLEPLFREFELIVQRDYGQEIPPQILDRARELATMDPDSFAFRYSNTKQGKASIQGGEYWVELPRLRRFMDVLVTAFHRIRHERSSDIKCGGKPREEEKCLSRKN